MTDSYQYPSRSRLYSLLPQLSDHLLARVYRDGWAASLACRRGWHGSLAVQHHDFKLDGNVGSLPPLRIGFASDFHAGPTTCDGLITSACRALADAAIDLLLLGGDFISLHARHIDRLAEQLERIPAPLGRFAVIGNHDIWADERYIVKRLEQAGVQVLMNRSVPLPAPYEQVWICGLDDPRAGTPDPQAAFRDTTGTRIVLMHSPDGLRHLDGWPFDLALCGHTHGGQIALPNGKPIVVPRGRLCRKFAAGRFKVGQNGRGNMVVSRGVGCTTLPVRAFSDPEIITCTLNWDRSDARSH